MNTYKNIVLSAHFDLSSDVPFMLFDSDGLHGLVDNFAGVFCSYEASRKTNTPLYLTNFEEVNLGGAEAVAKTLKGTDTLVIVVDTCTDAQDKGGYIGNAYNFSVDSLKGKFKDDIFFMDGLYEADMDETAIYGEDYHFPTFFYGVPIQNGYHDIDNHIKTTTIDMASQLLIEVIRHLQNQ